MVRVTHQLLQLPKNAPAILENLVLADQFDADADPSTNLLTAKAALISSWLVLVKAVEL